MLVVGRKDRTKRKGALTNLEQKSDEELRGILDDLYEEEEKISYQRRMLHGRIDILRAELTRRLKERHKSGRGVISGKDVERLTEILVQGLGSTKTDISK